MTWRWKAAVFAAVFLVLAAPAFAGPIDDALGDLVGNKLTWWAELVAVTSAALGLVMAVVPDSSMPKWLSSILNGLANNWGAAKNDPTVN